MTSFSMPDQFFCMHMYTFMNSISMYLLNVFVLMIQTLDCVAIVSSTV